MPTAPPASLPQPASERRALRRFTAVQGGLVALLALVLGFLVSPALVRGTAHYDVGQYTSASVRAPYDFTVLDEAATARRREEAARQSPLVVTVDPRVPDGVVSRLATAFVPLATLFTEAEIRRIPGQSELRGLSARQQAALRRRRAADVDRELAREVAGALAALEASLGVKLMPDEAAGLTRERFAVPVVRALNLLARDAYLQPVVSGPDLEALLEQASAPDGTRRLLVRDRVAGTETVLASQASLRTTEQAAASLPERADVLLADMAPEARRGVVRLLGARLAANAAFDRAASVARSAAAARAVLPISLTFRRNQLIIGEGQEVTREVVLALRYLETRRLPAAFVRRLAGSSVLFLLLLLCAARLARSSSRRGGDGRDLALAACGIALTAGLFWIWLSVVDRVVAGSPGMPALALALLFPVAPTAMLARFVSTARASLAQLLVLAVAVGLMAGQGVGLSAYTLVVGLAGCRAVASCNSRAGLMRTGAPVALAAGGMALALALLAGLDGWAGALAVAAGAVGGGTSGLLVVALAPVVERLFGYVTRISLLEMVSYEHPLLKRLMVEAPGTFQHSVSISLLADAAAAAVGADRLLVRVGALYHDVGKIANGMAFVENQSGTNLHDSLSPRESARVIRAHVGDGVELLRRHGFDERIADFIREHHGTRCIDHFLNLARQAGGAVDPADYRYPGPSPRSKETTILMIADQVEAIARTMPRAGREEFEALVRATVDRLRAERQFVEAPVTFLDLERIQRAMARVLVGMHHHRIEYAQAPAGAAER